MKFSSWRYQATKTIMSRTQKTMAMVRAITQPMRSYSMVSDVKNRDMLQRTPAGLLLDRKDRMVMSAKPPEASTLSRYRT